MTTITNFLECNFIDNAENKDEALSENPIWVLNAKNNTSFLNQVALKEYIIAQSVQAVKPFVHLDLGISLIKKFPSMSYKNVELENGLKICQPFQNKAYFILRTPISLRVQQNFLSNLVNQLNALNESKTFKSLINTCDIGKKYENKFCLLVEGIEAMLLLNKQRQIQSFIGQLSNLHESIRQVSIFTQEKLMNKQLMFTLQRISTCLTTLVSFNSVENVWQCVSTVRRYTGYSNQETYTMTLNKTAQKIKVTKKLNIINFNEETKEQKEMVDSLGFIVKKAQKDKKNQQQLKNMIYPYLKMRQQQCGCNQAQCRTTNCCKSSNTQDSREGLIILDDQQQDQDDIDV